MRWDRYQMSAVKKGYGPDAKPSDHGYSRAEGQTEVWKEATRNKPLTGDSTYAIIWSMQGKDHLGNVQNVLFADLLKICKKYFGKPRIRGSHYIFKTHWKGDPRINLQKVDKMAKSYQVRDVKKAIEKVEAKKNEK
jgi:hypothetical protein